MNAYYLSLKPEIPPNDYWAYGFLNDTLESLELDTKEVSELPEEDAAIVVIPGEYHAELVNDMNNQLARINHVVLFVMADEEAKFPVEEVTHPSIHIWVQYPVPGRHDAYNKLGTGYPQQSKEYLKNTPVKDLDLFFSGQLVHQRRYDLNEVLLHIESNQNYEMKFEFTAGFTQGMPHDQYYSNLSSAKLAPAPAGTITPDSFRLFEALESMAIPIADEVSPSGHITRYWDWLFGEETPFPKITDWERLYGLIPELLEDWPANVHRQTAWWIKYKRDFGRKLIEQLKGE